MGSRLFAYATSVVGILIAIAACSSDPPTTPASGTGDDASTTATDSGTVDNESGTTPDEDGGSDGGTVAGKTTNIVATFGAVARTIDRAQFGNSTSDAGKTLYIEAHEGGVPECPTENSPSPKRTLIIANVPRVTPIKTFTLADGIAVSFLDFIGDQIQSKPLTKATAATVTLMEVDGDTSVVVDVDATFPEGTAKGRAYATFCQSLSD